MLARNMRARPAFTEQVDEDALADPFPMLRHAEKAERLGVLRAKDGDGPPSAARRHSGGRREPQRAEEAAAGHATGSRRASSPRWRKPLTFERMRPSL